MRRRRSLALLAALMMALSAHATHARAQDRPFSGYLLNVWARQAGTPAASQSDTYLGRARFMAWAARNGIHLDVAYEHLTVRTAEGMPLVVTDPDGGAGAGGGDWLGLDWTVRQSSRTVWRHRFDRLALTWSRGPVELTAGRQAISWANTLFLTPADPFAPFDPSDPFREYRRGVDALRMRAFAGPFTEVEAVIRPAETPLGTTWTALVRAQTSRGGWAFGGWTGRVHDEPGVAAFASGALGATAVRAEAVLRRRQEGGTALRAAVGLDRVFQPEGRDLFLALEVMRDDFGAASASKLLEVYQSRYFQNGEIQSPTRWTVAGQSSLQAHALVQVDLLVLAAPAGDASALVSPGVTWLASASFSLRAGLFEGMGDGWKPGGVPGSAYGVVPRTVYVAGSWYF